MTIGSAARASRKMAHAPTAIAAPNGTVQTKSRKSGRSNSGSASAPSAKSLSLRPVNEPMPIETSDPMPAASRPGTSTIFSCAPPRPMASISSTAAITGEPKISATAENVPQAATSVATCGVASRRSRCTAYRPSAPPIAISGASGPRTRPSEIVASPARMTPGMSTGIVGSVLRPCAGWCPPRPGSRAMAKATITPATAVTGSGHQSGAVS